MSPELERIVQHARGVLARDVHLPDGGLARWEISASCRLDRPRAGVDVRGGIRLETPGTGSRRLTVVHGGMPEALAGLLGLPTGRPGWRWERVARSLHASLSSAAKAWSLRSPGALRALLDDSGTAQGGRLAAVAALRLRAWIRAEDRAPHGLLEGSLRVRASLDRRAWPVRAGAVVPFEGGTPEVPAALAAAGRALAARRARAMRLAGARLGPDRALDTTTGPVVLFEDLAAAWVHEMGHAALETYDAGERSGGRSFRIVDDPERPPSGPLADPWPFGSPWTDDGLPTRPVVLWGPGAASAADTTARHGEFDSEALPALTSTRLLVDERPAGGSEIPPDAILAAAPGPTRYDPASGRILLTARFVARRIGDTWCAHPGSAVLEIDPRECWERLEMMIGPPEVESDQAVCTRLGSLHAVMVGAPTILLDPVRVRPADPLRGHA